MADANNDSNSTGQAPSIPLTTDPIGQATETWKSKLLDLSKRNRALKFRPNKVSTIAIVNELPALAFKQLYVLEQQMKFAPKPEPPVNGAEQSTSAEAGRGAGSAEATEPESNGNGDSEPDVDLGLGLTFTPYDSSLIADRHSDEWLQTNRVALDLQKSLRRIEELSRETIEEQGVNTLFLALGMLQYYESDDSNEEMRAPLVLLPADLFRKGARDQYRLAAGNDDPVVNPSLREFLVRAYGIALPAFPDVDKIDEDFDLQTFFAAVTKAIEKQQRWSVKTDIYLSLFAFQKYVMYKDLEVNAAEIKRREFIQRVVSRSGGFVRRLPEDVETLSLDREFPPESTAQVVDADASQLRAMVAVSRGYDLVIEGPPGTGKSQTITNLVAQALSEGKTVLFVAEKMAALNVVFNRLTAVGLAEFCLELHSAKASRRQVLSRIAQALDLSGVRPQESPSTTGSLPAIRADLSAYAAAVHAPFGALAKSPYRIFGEVERLRHAARLTLELKAREVSQEKLEDALRRLRAAVRASTEIRPLRDSPWRDSGRTYYSPDQLEDVASLADSIRRQAARVRQFASAVEQALGFPKISTRADVTTCATVADAMRRSPGAPEAVLTSNEWNVPPPAATQWISRGRALKAETEALLTRCTREVLEQRHANDVEFVLHAEKSARRLVWFLDGRQRETRRRWRAYRRSSYAPTFLEQCEDMRRADFVQAERSAFEAAVSEGARLFGALWDGWRSDFDALSRYVEWVVGFRSECVRHSLSQRTISLAAKPRPNLQQVAELVEGSDQLFGQLAHLRSVLEWPADYIEAASFEAIEARCAALSAGVNLGPRWATFESLRQDAMASIAAPAIVAVMDGRLEVDESAAAFAKAFYQKWLDELLVERPLLRQFSSIAHEERVKEFAELDQRVLRENRGRLLKQLRDSRRAKLLTQECKEGLPFLQREIARQRRGSSLRAIIRGAEPALRALKPCFLMSPLSVAQYLKGGESSFDVVIFDEASQLPPEDAVGTIMRGRQVVVVGDPKQLPPTAFFQTVVGETRLSDDDQNTYTGDTESILDEIMGSGVPMSRLRWHYRSAHESLIAFSNAKFYDTDLVVFPSVTHDRSRLGLSFELVPDGVYEGKGINQAEAARVVDAVVEFARDELARQERSGKMESLGVGTFNLRQQLVIQEMLEARRIADPSLEPFFDRGRTEPFFVKNLENIQGDERDHIFLSVTYGKAQDGILRYNFGALNGQNGQRRLNVLVTRARRRLRVFSSMRAADMNPRNLANEGPVLLKEFLRYAETGHLDSPTTNPAAETESPFEVEVLAEFCRRGVEAHPQVGVGRYRIDFGITDPDFPGEYLCGVECDGASYHSSETARDRDRLRQEVLEERGWTIHRIWSTDWWKDRSGQVDRVLRKIAQTREAAVARRSEHGSGTVDAAPSEGPPDPPDTVPTPSDPTAYSRPVAAPYLPASLHRRRDADVLSAQSNDIRIAIMEVLKLEAPIHVDDLVARVAGGWGRRCGSRIREYILSSLLPLVVAGSIRQAGEFVYLSGGAVVARSRAGMTVTAGRIAPEEYEAAALLVLAGGASLTREMLTSEIRSVLGFARTGARLDEEITSAIDALLARGHVAHNATGLNLVCEKSTAIGPTSPVTA